MLPAFDSGQDVLWVGGPDEGFWIGVCVSDKAVDGDLEFNDGSEYASLEATARELAKKPSTALSQDAEVGVKWSVHREWRQPLAHLRMLVGRIVVDDGVDYFPCRDLLLDRIEKANELLVTMGAACCGR